MIDPIAVPMSPVIDGCTEVNCPRCLTVPHARGDMEHAGIGSRPQADPAPSVAEIKTTVMDEFRECLIDNANLHRALTAADRHTQAAEARADALAGVLQRFLNYVVNADLLDPTLEADARALLSEAKK